MTGTDSLRTDLDRDGYAMLRGAFTPADAADLVRDVEAVLSATPADDPAIRGGEGTVYAARNLLGLWPGLDAAWRRPALLDVLCRVLGPGFGLVRVLYFDKPPENSWALPWHKDLTIAVADNRLPSERFRKPTRKAGVPHVEAPEEVLAAMLTARIHLDDVTDENGPLKVIPGSPATGKTLRFEDARVRTIHAAAGEVLLMRPLLAHCSNRSRPDTTRHRRLLHLEFAASAELPDGFRWYSFQPGLKR